MHEKYKINKNYLNSVFQKKNVDTTNLINFTNNNYNSNYLSRESGSKDYVKKKFNNSSKKYYTEKDTNDHYYQKRQKTVDLKQNGRLFPSWILHKFKEYTLDPVKLDKDQDPCSVTSKKEYRKYQKFVSRYLDFRSQQRSLLLYHALGSGKSATAILLMSTLYKATPDWNVFILIKASLQDDPWMKDLKGWLSTQEYDEQLKNIKFIHYDSPFADNDFQKAVKESDPSKKNMFIIDEAHNFIRNVYSNINSKAGKRAQNIYDHLIRDIKENSSTRILLISGTPIINSNYELVLMFNLLRPNCFPKSENEFNKLFVTHGSLNPSKKNLFQRRILGLTSFYVGSTPDTYATKKISNVDLIMEEYHESIYRYFEDLEHKAGSKKLRRKTKSVIDIYRPYTRPACNFVFPAVNEKIMGDTKPTPSRFRISEKDAVLIETGKETKLKAEKNTEKFLDVSGYLNEMKLFMTKTEEYFFNISAEDKLINHTILDDYENYKNKYAKNFRKFRNRETKKSKLFNKLYECSPKYLYCIFKILDSEGSTVTYSNYVRMEGLEIFKMILRLFGFGEYDPNKKTKNAFSYAEYSGILSREQRIKNRKTFNSIENINGEVIKVFLISPSGSEGINLLNVRQMHILEPFWNNVRIDQVIGRAIRQCSHRDLPMSKRHVDVFKYKCIRKNGKETSDQHIETIARNKESSNQSFLDAIKEAAVDCGLYKSHNMLINEYKCFQFSEESLFQKNISPAFLDDIYDDLKMDDGSNSTSSITKSIRVRKISAIIRLNNESKENDTDKFSKSKQYWISDESGVVYDLELHYPVGRVSKDQNDLLIKYDKDNYIIDYVIPLMD